MKMFQYGNERKEKEKERNKTKEKRRRIGLRFGMVGI